MKQMFPSVLRLFVTFSRHYPVPASARMAVRRSGDLIRLNLVFSHLDTVCGWTSVFPIDLGLVV